MITSAKLYELLQNPSKIRDQDEAELKSAAEQFPYCQSLQFLLAQHFREHNEYLFQRQLGKTALLTNDRSVLFEFFEERAPVSEQASLVSESRDQDEMRKKDIPDPNGNALDAPPLKSPQQSETSTSSSEQRSDETSDSGREVSAPAESLAYEETKGTKTDQNLPRKSENKDTDSTDYPGETESLETDAPGSPEQEKTSGPSDPKVERKAVNTRVQKILERNRQLRTQSEGSRSTDAAPDSSSQEDLPNKDLQEEARSPSSPDQASKLGSQTDTASEVQTSSSSEDRESPAESPPKNQASPDQQSNSQELNNPPNDASLDVSSSSIEEENSEQAKKFSSDSEYLKDGAPEERSANKRKAEAEAESSQVPEPKEEDDHSLEEATQLEQRSKAAKEDTSLTTNELEADPEERTDSSLSKPNSDTKPTSGKYSETSEPRDVRDDEIERRIEAIRSQLAQLQGEEKEAKHKKGGLPLEGQVQKEEHTTYLASFTTNELELSATEGHHPDEGTAETRDKTSSKEDDPAGDKGPVSGETTNPGESLDSEFLEIEALVKRQQADNPPTLLDENTERVSHIADKKLEDDSPAGQHEPERTPYPKNLPDTSLKENVPESNQNRQPASEQKRAEGSPDNKKETHSFSFWLKKLSKKETKKGGKPSNPNSKPGEDLTHAGDRGRDGSKSGVSKRKAGPEQKGNEKKAPGRGEKVPYPNSRNEQESLPVEDKIQLLDSFVEKLPELKKKRPEEKPNPSPDTTAKTSPEEPKVPRHISLVTETLAQVYIKQKHYKKAIQAYEILKLKYPEKSSSFARRIEEIQNLNNSK